MIPLKPKLPDLERTTRNAIINAEFWRAHSYAHLLPIPDLHGVRDAHGETKWFLQDELMSTNAGASLFIGKFNAECGAPDQLHIEIRLFWPHLQGKDLDYPSHFAVLWAEWGGRYFGDRREYLLDDLKPGNWTIGIRENGIDTLWRKIRLALEPALARAKQLQSESALLAAAQG